MAEDEIQKRADEIRQRYRDEIRPGTQRILMDLRSDEVVDVETVRLRYLAEDGGDFRERWVDVFYALEIMAGAEWPGARETFAVFENAFPTLWPLEYCQWMHMRSPHVSVAFFRTFQAAKGAGR
jgi:hypothetical protein